MVTSGAFAGTAPPRRACLLSNVLTTLWSASVAGLVLSLVVILRSFPPSVGVGYRFVAAATSPEEWRQVVAAGIEPAYAEGFFPKSPPGERPG